MYIQGVLGALNHRLKSAKNYYKQLNLIVSEKKAKVREKTIPSMTPEEYQKSQEDVSKLIDELQTAIKSNRGHLAKLGPQLQAEQEQFSSYVCQHIKSLPANTMVPGDLQLKAKPQFVLTYLEDLTADVDVSQTEHIPHRAWTTVHHEHRHHGGEEGLQKHANSPFLKQLLEPSDTHVVPGSSLEATEQLTVLLLRKVERKHPRAPAQRTISAERKETRRATNYSETERNKIEFHRLLERCTEILNLPSAAQRLFNDKGKEIFSWKDLQRDELNSHQGANQKAMLINSIAAFLVSGPGICFMWRTLDQSRPLHCSTKKQVFLRSLEVDISKIKTFCSMRKVEALVLEVQGDLVSGGKLAVNKPLADFEEKQMKEPEGKQIENAALIAGDASRETLDSHARAHLRMEACRKMLKYAWQDPSYSLADDDSLSKKMEKKLFKNVQPPKKHSHFPKHRKLQKLCYQEFEYRDGQIISLAAPQLVLGVQGFKSRSGTEVVLVEKKSDDCHQCWMHKEDGRTFHLASNPDLVLAVSMTKAQNEGRGYPVIIQKYKPYSNGAANQKWHYMENRRTLIAFHSTTLDKEITAANSAGLCTSSVTKENIDQPGYCYLSPDGKRKIMLCLACGRSMGAEKGLRPLLLRASFFCASGSEQKSLPRGPFKVISVAKADLSSYEAENTLRYYEKRLSSLWLKTRACTATHGGVVASYQKAVKIIAYKNGDGYRNGKLIVAGTFPGLLAECTERLKLTRAASKIYTRDGTTILTLHGLIVWAVGESLLQRDPEEQEKSTESVGTEELAVQNTEESSRLKMESRLDYLEGIDKSLLARVLRSPIAIWVSCGEPFLPLNAPQKSEKLKKQDWLKRDKILTDLDTMRHKMRQLKGRRVAACQPATMVPTQSPLQPVIVQGGWTEETPEETKLMELIRQTEAHLSEGQERQSRCSLITAPRKRAEQLSLYQAPAVKRVWVYENGQRPDGGTYAWASAVSELLDVCTACLKMSHQAKTLYTSNGEPIQSWDDIERDMTVCVSAGHGFITSKEKKQVVEVKANYARVRRQHGPEATDIVVAPSVQLLSLMQLHN